MGKRRSPPSEPPETPEAKFERMTKFAADLTKSELSANRKKTARLKAERLAKEAAAGITDLDRKKSRRPKPSSR
jgi:hypothetical protein